jgi:HAD superfamily hydrolase (TIGR01509 family)
VFEAAIFDWDGTLADTREAILASFHGALHEVLGIDVSDEFMARRIGVGAAWTFREILASKGLPVDAATIKQLVEVKVRVALENSDKVKLFPGAKPLLQSLRGKVKLGLASMNNRAVIDSLLTALDVVQFFNVVITVDEVTRSKPEPEIFLKTAEKLGTEPRRCVVLEDSVFGVQAAKAGGMGCVAVAQGFYTIAELKNEKPDLVIGSLLKKDAILGFILRT